MRKNIASQSIGAQMVTASDGSAFTGSVSVSVTIDNGTQTAGGGTAPAHEGNGYHSYTPTQAETNGDHIAFTFTGTGAIPATVQVYTRPTTGLLAPTTADRTLDVTAGGAAGIDWGNIENPATVVDLSGTDINLVDTTTTNTDMRGTDNALLAASAPTNFGDLAITVTSGQVTVGTNNDKTGYSISGTKTTLDALNDVSAADVNAQCDTALSDYDAPTKTEMDAAFTEIKGATWSSATDTLEAIRDRGDAAWITATGFSTHSAADVRAEMDSNSTQLAAIVSDTNELQTDWANGGRLDLILDARASQTTADAIETDTQDIQSRLPAALVSGRMSSDMVALSGSTTAADNLEEGAKGVATGAAQTGTLSTTSMTTNLSETTDDHYNGRTIVFVSGALAGQATDVTDYDGTAKQLTFTAVTEAPSDGDTFVIV